MEQEVQLIYPLIRMPVSKIPCFIFKLIFDIFESGLFRKLNALNYQPMTCDGLPEYQIQNKEGNVFEVNFTEGWIWRRNPTNGKAEPEEADQGVHFGLPKAIVFLLDILSFYYFVCHIYIDKLV